MQLPRVVLTAVVAAAASIASARASNIHPMIVGGEPVPAGAKTYVVGLRETADDTSNCGGSLITPTHVLTAAHCASHGRYKFAAVGTHFLEGHTDGERIAIVNSVVHPKYDYTTLSYDVAVLTLATPATRATPVALQSGAVDTIAGDKAVAMGWGQISDEADQSEELLRVEMKIWTASDCAGAKLSRAPDATMLCAGGKNWKDICKGDSGGPLVRETKARDVVAGVTSWSNGCGVKGRPSVFAQVAAAADFIRKNAPNATFV